MRQPQLHERFGPQRLVFTARWTDKIKLIVANPYRDDVTVIAHVDESLSRALLRLRRSDKESG